MVVKCLANGAEVALRPVPIHVRRMLSVKMFETLPPEPQVPRDAFMMVKSAAGHSEQTMQIDEDSESYRLWVDEHNEWLRKRQVLIQEHGDDNTAEIIGYAVTAWRHPGNGVLGILRRVLWRLLDAGWQRIPADTWHVKDSLVERGVLSSPTTPEERRLQYIMVELLQHGVDYDIVLDTATGEASARPITRREVESAAGGFRPD